jgi:hypothetical protein
MSERVSRFFNWTQAAFFTFRDFAKFMPLGLLASFRQVMNGRTVVPKGFYGAVTVEACVIGKL